MQPWQALANFESESGAGYDAAGRRVYSGPQFMYMGPGDKSATQMVHSQLQNRANEADGGGMIRALLAERNRNAARHSGVDPSGFLQLDVASGGRTYAPDHSTVHNVYKK